MIDHGVIMIHNDLSTSDDDDDDLEDENYFGDDISVLSVNNCNSSNSRDLVQRLDQLGVAHHLVPE